MLEIDSTFPHSYEDEGLGDLPGTGRFSVPSDLLPATISSDWQLMEPMDQLGRVQEFAGMD